MTMLFDIEKYQHPDSQNHKGDWDGVKYDSAWDDGSAFPEKNYKTSLKEKARSNKTDCWYSPPSIVELIIQVLGEINLDPCADDGQHIPAGKHYTFDDNGLEQPWCGKVYMNPPYSHPGAWMRKLQLEFETGNVDEAIALVPAATDTNWLSPVLKTQPVCFWKGRIKFLGQDYQPKSSARQSHVLVYWGNNWQKFREVFEDYGVVYFPISSVYHDKVLGENVSLNDSPGTRIEDRNQTLDNSSSKLIHANTQISNDDKVLGGNISLNNSPSTRIEGESLTPDNSSSISTISNAQVSNDDQVLGENISPTNSPSTYRKRGEGSGNISWGYANANSTKKKPVKQLYFEWEYRGKRGKTYVRSRFKEQVISMNEAKVPVVEILKLLTYNPKIAGALGLN